MANAQFENGYAAVFGSDLDVSATARDAAGVAAVLKDLTRCGYPDDHVICRVKSQATKAGIIQGLAQLPQDPNTTVIVYYSGHGDLIDGTFYLSPTDADPHHDSQTAIAERELTRILQAIPARKLLVVLDCCHAGAIELRSSGLHSAVSQPNMEQVPANALDSGWGRVMLASSLAHERAGSGSNYSTFTTAFIEALSGVNTMSFDGYVHLTDIIRHTCMEVPLERGRLQNPIFSSTGATDFVLAHYAGGQVDFSAVSPPAELVGANKITISVVSTRLGRKARISGTVDETVDHFVQHTVDALKLPREIQLPELDQKITFEYGLLLKNLLIPSTLTLQQAGLGDGAEVQLFISNQVQTANGVPVTPAGGGGGFAWGS